MKIKLFLGLLFLFALEPSVALADNIQTRNASAQSTVENNVQGNGNVTTHIETSANGQTNVIDTQGNGQINVTNNNGNVTITKTPQVTIVQTLNSTPTPKIIYKHQPKTPSLVSGLFENLTNFLKRIFRNL